MLKKRLYSIVQPLFSTTSFYFLSSIFILIFSSWLMFHTFSYDAKKSNILIAGKAFSDFGAHIPLIRSFSLGDNWPPQYPIYPGEPIRYHFLFYFFVGMLEKAGIRIDWALNIPSIIGFAGFLIALGTLAYLLFRDKRIVILSVIFTLFNGSLTFLRFFKEHPLSVNTPLEIFKNNTFPSFAPWGDGDITAFWNLNIFTNQRHLGMAFFFILLTMVLLVIAQNWRLKKQLWILPVLVAVNTILPWFHQPALLMVIIISSFYFVLFKNLRVLILLIAIFSEITIFPQIRGFNNASNNILWYPGYLIHDQLNPIRFISYWFNNIGLHLILIPLGWLIAPWKVKKATLPIFAIFFLGFGWKFSVEIAANHKFFNFFLSVGSILSAYTIIASWNAIKKKVRNIFLLFPLFIALCSLLIALTLSGVIDLFPVINDGYMTVEDIPKNEAATWIKNNTPPDAIFLNSSFFFHPASLAGRKIFLGWPYFSWSAGYSGKRSEEMKIMYESHDPQVFCPLFKKYNISYLTAEEIINDYNLPHINPLQFMTIAHPVYTKDKIFIFSVSSLCPNP